MLQVRTIAEGEGEGFEAGGVHAQLFHDVISGKKHRATIDAAGKTNANRLLLRNLAQPLGDFLREGANVTSSDFGQILRELISLRIEKAGVSGIGIRAADELNFHHVMGRNHPGVAGVELFGQTFPLEPLVNCINPIGHDQSRPFGAFGQKIAYRAVEGAR